MQKENEEPRVDEIKEIEEFENPNDFNPSTQIEKTVTIEDIFNFHETNDEFLKDNGIGTKSPPTIDIPDDTMDKIISGIEVNSEEPVMNNTSKEDMFTENMLLKSKLKSAEESLKEKEQKTLEMETNMIDANTELANLRKNCFPFAKIVGSS